MSILSENIKLYRKQSKLTQKELAARLGIAPTAVSAWELGRNKPLMDNIEQMAILFGVKKSILLGETLGELTSPSDSLLNDLTGKVVQLTSPRQRKVLTYATEQLEEQQAERKVIDLHEPLYEYRVYEKASAGVGYGYTGDRTYDTVYFDEDIPHDFATWISGDSMEPTYLNGEVALIRDSGYDYDGAIYLIDWDGQSYIKKAYKEKDGLRLVSLNKKYADKFAAWEEEPRIIGKVIGSFAPVER